MPKVVIVKREGPNQWKELYPSSKFYSEEIPYHFTITYSPGERAYIINDRRNKKHLRFPAQGRDLSSVSQEIGRLAKANNVRQETIYVKRN